ncbi:hydroxyacid dehydrogenase [Rhodovulum sulfidophilum]|uniref:NAD(P)-dependent oxidoreductase n=1 Tax=Rhodovulum sulfidophilum TaxID=35806 RepID=UPI001923AAAE|nr:NAD(P)-dependent oxidoreductase [Rhodovulum sulfidophilum]MBL3575956.1 hydroxyacid dehydrogenase [Rhodovulum sulfidophilum]MCE8431865.1 hydroxyacid dehydrogenase [Rhodovulum sulfidophilum]MCF4115689.1 hydroxyacid dehydrogenase [Rhodovulum sulfidophilum]
MIPRPVVHVLEPIHPAALEILGKSADLLGPETPFPSECDAVIVRARRLTAAEIAACPRLRVIGKHGAGLDAIDVAAAEARGIAVLSTPGANAESVADLAVGFSLALLRNIHGATLALKVGEPLDANERQGWDLNEISIGIFGLGAIGRATAARMVGGFGASVQAFDPGLGEAAWPQDVTRVASLKDLLQSSRLLIIHAPLVPGTRNAIDANALDLMPEGAFLVNCARGGIVDEPALAVALRSGRIAGAAADVFAEEPPAADNPLLACPGFLATPHLGGATNGALLRVGRAIVDQVLDRLSMSAAGADGASDPIMKEN